jgi:hypothetical protein
VLACREGSAVRSTKAKAVMTAGDGGLVIYKSRKQGQIHGKPQKAE